MVVHSSVQPFDSSRPELIADPYPIYAEYRATDPVHYSEAKRSWFVFSHELVTAAFRDPAISAERSRADKHPNGRSPLRQIDQDGPNHRIIRNSLNTAFYPMVAAFGPRSRKRSTDASSWSDIEATTSSTRGPNAATIG